MCPRCGKKLIEHDDGTKFCINCPCILEFTYEGWVDIGYYIIYNNNI